MECKKSNLWLGLGIGSVIGAIVYRLSCTSKAKQMKAKACDMFRKVGDEAGELLMAAKEKAMETSMKMADTVADTTYNIAEKADDIKGKVHTAASDVKL